MRSDAEHMRDHVDAVDAVEAEIGGRGLVCTVTQNELLALPRVRRVRLLADALAGNGQLRVVAALPVSIRCVRTGLPELED